METRVLKAKDVAVLHRGNGFLRDFADAIVGERDRLSDQMRKRGGDGFQRVLGVASLGPAEMREQYCFAARAGNFGDGRSDAFEPCGIGDAAIFHGNVEIDAQQYALALHVDVIEGAECLVHATLPTSSPRIAV
jgi:hypothetical protein